MRFTRLVILWNFPKHLDCEIIISALISQLKSNEAEVHDITKEKKSTRTQSK